MPIVGMTDRVPSFPQIGTIRKGGPKGANRPGPDLTYLRVQFDEAETEAEALFRSIYHDQPQEINILLPFDEIDRCWEAWREAYVAGALVHRCDGEYVNYAINTHSGEVLVRDGRVLADVNGYQVGDRVPCSGKADCRPRGRLRVIVPELRRLAYLMLLTGSIHDIVNISAQLEAIRRLNGGCLRGIPLVLRRRPKRISTPSGEGGKRARREKWLLSIEADPSWVQAKLAAVKWAALPGEPERLIALPEPEEEVIEADLETVETTANDADTYYSFLARVRREIPYYQHREHIINTMRTEGWTWSRDDEDELFDLLSQHARRRADERAAIESGDIEAIGAEAEQKPLAF